MPTTPDDLDAVRILVATLSVFEAIDQERILRWAREKLGLATQATVHTPPTLAPGHTSKSPSPPALSGSHGTATDIKSFVSEKAPSSNNEFAATVAYYYRFEAPETARKDSITAEDLQEACRLAGRARLPKPSQTLINAHQVGLVDKSGDRGAYAISTVGENLVAMTLPLEGKRAKPQRSSRKKVKPKNVANATKAKEQNRRQSKKAWEYVERASFGRCVDRRT